MRHLVATLLMLALPAYADDAPTVLDVETAIITTPTGEVVTIRDGCWLDTRRCIAAGKALAGDDAEKEELRKAVPSVPWMLVAFGVGLVVGGAVGAGVVWAATRR